MRWTVLGMLLGLLASCSNEMNDRAYVITQVEESEATIPSPQD